MIMILEDISDRVCAGISILQLLKCSAELTSWSIILTMDDIGLDAMENPKT